MNVTTTLLNAKTGGTRTLSTIESTNPDARLVLNEALAAYPHTIPDGIYSARITWNSNRERTFLLECKGNRMKELFSYY
jgi:hypothetical protein